MSKYTPLYRRILPWAFFLLFCILGPLLIFYTSGYRYNPKKALIERNGTYILDSTPKKAHIFLDGQETGETTPFTLQNVSPGLHTIGIEKHGYAPWKKTLEVKPEQVTFANEVWLWKTATPTLVEAGIFLNLQEDASRRKIATIRSTTSSTALMIQFWTPDRGFTPSLPIPYTSSTIPMITWTEDGKGLFLEKKPNVSPDWYLSYAASTPALEIPPNTPLTIPPVIDRLNQYHLESSTSTKELQLVDDSFLGHRFQLPVGLWRFAGQKGPYILFYDSSRWLVMTPSLLHPIAQILEGDRLRWLDTNDEPAAITVHQTEIWQWNAGERPELVWRQSEPIINALWHRSGTGIIFATRTTIFGLDLDSRDGRTLTSLASFESIEDIAIIEKTLYISGKKDGIDGLWSLALE